jgi:hypothetical protein
MGGGGVGVGVVCCCHSCSHCSRSHSQSCCCHCCWCCRWVCSYACPPLSLRHPAAAPAVISAALAQVACMHAHPHRCTIPPLLALVVSLSLLLLLLGLHICTPALVVMPSHCCQYWCWCWHSRCCCCCHHCCCRCHWGCVYGCPLRTCAPAFVLVVGTLVVAPSWLVGVCIKYMVSIIIVVILLTFKARIIHLNSNRSLDGLLMDSWWTPAAVLD